VAFEEAAKYACTLECQESKSASRTLVFMHRDIASSLTVTNGA
jgi:hypothetical protein